MRWWRLVPWSTKAQTHRRRVVAARAWAQHEREAAVAKGLLLDQAARGHGRR